MNLGFGLALGSQGASARVFDVSIDINITGQSGLLDLVVTEPADYAGTYTINLTALAAAPQLLRAAPAPTGTQALGETLTGRPALWAADASQTMEIERRWWKGNGLLRDQGGHPPLNLLYECEWHSDAQEPFRIDERARYVADPVNSWSEWQEGDETTPPHPSPLLAASFARADWFLSPVTSHAGLVGPALADGQMRGVPGTNIRQYGNTNKTTGAPNGAVGDEPNQGGAALTIRENAFWYKAASNSSVLFLSSVPAMTVNGAAGLTFIAGLRMDGQYSVGGRRFVTVTANTAAVGLQRSAGELRFTARVGASAVLLDAGVPWADYETGATDANPITHVIGGRYDSATGLATLWVDGAILATAGDGTQAGQTINVSENNIGFLGSAENGLFHMDVGALTGVFAATYALTDAEMADVMGHIGRAIGTVT